MIFSGPGNLEDFTFSNFIINDFQDPSFSFHASSKESQIMDNVLSDQEIHYDAIGYAPQL